MLISTKTNLLITFQGKDKQASRNNDRDRKQSLKEEDAAFFNRPEDDSNEGYVTTPYQSDDEARPSARRRARETKREFNSLLQIFYKLLNQ